MVAIAIITVLVLCGIVVWNNLSGPKDSLVLIGMLISAAVVFSWMLFSISEYKQGQIDALTGNVKYELKTESDSTRIWIEKAK